ncbi:hypothetical protein NP590_19435 [Methylomonas sp. SURF-2]|uniref:Uncharacterized protein n=1 Tax=Methylomonas subterranea TaxID=2952225 RepID=A0ABT1TLD6_9GAMM|nr:hypothetical protein [Methylomonas sp. SURF-2]MCQ8106287.1 hypothetical protein [Methylomonas sp. SURF-2]
MEPLLFRFLERITVVLIGGMSIYLGYRLFLAIPHQQDSEGRIRLPADISIVMVRIGPGVFFALFGVMAVCLSLIKPLQIQANSGNPVGNAESISYLQANQATDDSAARADARVLIRKEIEILNTLPQLLRQDLAEHERTSVVGGIARIKLLLMQPAWDEAEAGFGDYASFENWVKSGESGAPPPNSQTALALFRRGMVDKRP